MVTKLFCIPHAGGSASVYVPWKKELNPEIQLIPVELAGRGMRYDEPFYKNWQDATKDIYLKIVSRLEPGERYAIYGHSMGSWLAFEVLSMICEKRIPQPVHMFFSGNTPPYLEPEEEKISGLPDEEFIKKIIALGDTPKEIFAEEVVGYFLPVLRNDYEMVESYPHKYHNVDYAGDINVFYGKYDTITRENAMLWNRYMHRKFYLQEFDSGHMFIKEQAGIVVNYINDILGKEER